MRNYLISAGRHVAGAAVAVLSAFLAANGLEGALDPDTLEGLRAAVEALVLGAGLVAYALVEKALKPLMGRIFGSEGA